MHLRGLVFIAVLMACGGTAIVEHQPWGQSVAVDDILAGQGYTATLELGDATLRLTIDPTTTVFTSTEAGLSLLYLEDEFGSHGFRDDGDGWAPTDEAAPTWPAALLVPSYADLLVAAGEAEPVAASGEGLTWFRAGPLDLSELSLGPDLHLEYGLNTGGRVQEWRLGSEPGAATITWSLRDAVAGDLVLPDGVVPDP